MQKNPMSVMTVYKNMLIPALLACLLFSPVRAEKAKPSANAPCKTLKACLTELQDDPDNRELREKIIKLALKLKNPPAVPEKAERWLARGRAAIKAAEDKEGFQEAVREFEKAALAAPWLAEVYYNLGLVQDKAGDYADAMQSFQLYLLAAPKAEDAKEVKSLIYEIEYRRDAAAQEEKKFAKILGSWEYEIALHGRVCFGDVHCTKKEGSLECRKTDTHCTAGGKRVLDEDAKSSPFLRGSVGRDGTISWEFFRGGGEYSCENNRGWHAQTLKWSKGDRKITISQPTWLIEDINYCPKFYGYNVHILRRE